MHACMPLHGVGAPSESLGPAGCCSAPVAGRAAPGHQSAQGDAWARADGVPPAGTARACLLPSMALVEQDALRAQLLSASDAVAATMTPDSALSGLRAPSAAPPPEDYLKTWASASSPGQARPSASRTHRSHLIGAAPRGADVAGLTARARRGEPGAAGLALRHLPPAARQPAGGCSRVDQPRRARAEGLGVRRWASASPP